MKKIAITEDKLSTLRDMLPHGSGKRIAEKLGCSQILVSRVLNGKSNCPQVINAALEIIKDNNRLNKMVDRVLQIS